MEAVYQRLMGEASPGQVVLPHDGSSAECPVVCLVPIATGDGKVFFKITSTIKYFRHLMIASVPDHWTGKHHYKMTRLQM